MASIDKRPSGTYRVRWRPLANGPQKSKTFDRRKDAERFLATVQGQIVSGTYVDPDAGRVSLSDFLDEWGAAQQWKASTRQTWPDTRRRIVDRLGSQRLDTIDRLTMQRFQAELSDDYALSTVRLTMDHLKPAMRAAYDSGRIGRDPTRGLRAAKLRAGDADRRVGPDQVPTVDEALAIWSAAPAPYRAAIALGLSGLRIGEVLGMTVDRLDLDRRTVTVDRQAQRLDSGMTFTSPKAEKVRTIVVPGVVALELRRHVRDHQPDGVLFPAQRTLLMSRPELYRRAWYPALAGAGLERRFVFHALRHFCASKMLAEGVPITAVAGHLGDTVETVSRTYAHWLRDDRMIAADTLDRLLTERPEADSVTG